VTTDQETQLCADIKRIADALEAAVPHLCQIAATLEQAQAQQAEAPPARPVHHAAAPQRRVTA